jgi:WD40 repeat protein
VSLLLCVAAAADAPPAGGARPVAKLAGPAGTAVAFSRDGKLLLTAGGGEARVWDAATYEPRTPPLNHRRALSSAALSASGKCAVTSAGGEAVVWDARGTRLHTLDHPGMVHDVDISSDEATLATACSDGSARLWDAATGRLLAELKHEGSVATVSFGPDGRRLLTSASDKAGKSASPRRDTPPEAGRPAPRQVYVWDVGRKREVARLLRGYDDCVDRPAFSPDGRRVGVPAGWYGAIVCDAESGDHLARRGAITGYYGVTTVGFSRDGTRFLAAGDDGGEEVDAALRVMTLEPAPDGPLAFKFHTLCRLFPNTLVAAAAISPDGATVVSVFPEPLAFTGFGDDALVVGNVASGRDVLRVPEPRRRSGDPRSRRCVAFSPDGRRVAAGFASDGYTAVWEVPGATGP